MPEQKKQPNIVHVGYSSTNYYVIEANNVRMLIDVGVPGSYGQLLANLKRKGIPIQSIDYLLVTHYHPDHAGVVEEVKAEGVKLILMEPQVDGVTFMQTYIKADSPYIPIRLDNNLIVPIHQSREFLKGLGLEGEIIPTPGHSDDSVSLVLDDGSAFVGDLTFPGFTTDEDRAVVIQSWEKLRALKATAIYTGHAPTQPVDFPEKLFEK